MRLIKKKGKKGFMAEPVVFFFSFLTFLLFTLIFFLIFSFKGCSGKTFAENIGDSTTVDAEGNYLLTGFLRKPLAFDINNDGISENATIIELIIWSKENNDYDLLSSELKKHFGNTALFWDFAIYDFEGEKIYGEMRSDYLHRSIGAFIEKVTIPDYKKYNSPLTVRLLISAGVEL